VAGKRVDEIDAILHAVSGGARRNCLRAISIDSKREGLGSGVVLGRVVEKLVVHVGIVRRASSWHEAQVPPGEDTRRSVDVLLDIIAEPERKELHDLATEILLRTRPEIRPAVEKHHHGRIHATASRRSRNFPSAN
jgi:hypothetical protein